MAIAETVGRPGATLLDMVHTRLEPASVEIGEQSQRYVGFLLMSLLALFVFGIAVGTPAGSRRCLAWPRCLRWRRSASA